MASPAVARDFLHHLLSAEALGSFPVVKTPFKILLHTGRKRIYHQVEAPLENRVVENQSKVLVSCSFVFLLSDGSCIFRGRVNTSI